jgi:hypothetical protein
VNGQPTSRERRRALGIGVGQGSVYRPRAGTRKGPRHPLAMPLDEYGTPYADEPGGLIDEVRRVLS